MRGNDKVLAELNAALSAELTAIVQYMVHAEMQDNWGYHRLGAYIKKQAIGEMRHAEGLIERILFLEGTPRVDIGLRPSIGPSVKIQLERDLAGEHQAIRDYNASVKICVLAGDNASRELFEGMVKDENEHALYLESQLHAIGEMGVENYLARQIIGEEKG